MKEKPPKRIAQCKLFGLIKPQTTRTWPFWQGITAFLHRRKKRGKWGTGHACSWTLAQKATIWTRRRRVPVSHNNKADCLKPFSENRYVHRGMKKNMFQPKRLSLSSSACVGLVYILVKRLQNYLSSWKAFVSIPCLYRPAFPRWVGAESGQWPLLLHLCSKMAIWAPPWSHCGSDHHKSYPCPLYAVSVPVCSV